MCNDAEIYRNSALLFPPRSSQWSTSLDIATMPSRAVDLFLLAVLGSLAPAYVFGTAITHAETRRVLMVRVLSFLIRLCIPLCKHHVVHPISFAAGPLFPQLNVAASLCALLATVRFIPVVKQYTLKRGMFGLDINKRGTPAGDVKVRLAAKLGSSPWNGRAARLAPLTPHILRRFRSPWAL